MLPGLAEEWSSEADGSVWTFKIRPNVVFHDGTPLTVEDVIWTYEKILADAKSPLRGYISYIKGLSKVDDRTVRIELGKKFIPFDRWTTNIYIISKRAFDKVGAAEFAKKPIGSGPFKVVEWKKDEIISLKAHPEYWGGAPKVNELVFKPIPSEPIRATSLTTGEVDLVPNLPPSLVERLAKAPDIKLERVESIRTISLGFNMNNPVLADPKLRQAIDYAIDRKAITQQLLRGAGVPLGQAAPPLMFGYDPSIPPTEYDPVKAKQLVKDSKYDGKPLPLEYANNRYAFADQTSQAIAGYLEAAGIKIDLKSMEFAAFFPLWLQNKMNGLYTMSMGISTLDGDALLNLFYEKDVGHGYWTDAEKDALIEAQRTEASPEKRKQIIQNVWKRSRDFVAYAPLYVEVQTYGMRDKVKWSPRADERLDFSKAEVAN